MKRFCTLPQLGLLVLALALHFLGYTESSVLMGMTTALGGEGGEGEGGAPPNDDTGGGDEHWTNSLPEEMREPLKGFESFDQAAEALKGPEIPESYAAPEDVQLDQETFEAFTPVAKELGLTQEQVGGLAKFHAELFSPEKVQETVSTQVEGELSEFKKGMSEQDFSSLVTDAKKARDVVGPELGAWFDESGMGNHPQIINALATIYRKGNFGEDSPPGSTSRGQNKSMYPNSNMNR